VKQPPVALIELVLHTEACMAAIVTGSVLEKNILDMGDCEPLSKAILEHHERVKGNRPGSVDVQWSDIRLAFAGALRICLAHLEGS
jgi:hypothetical protein